MPGINGSFVRDFRIGQAWSQEQLAELAGVSARTIARLERSCTASLETIKALSSALGVPLPSLMPGINGKFVRDFRIGQAWSQEQLAELAGVSARTIARLERSCTASLETIKALSSALGVPLPSLMPGNAMDSLVKRITPMTVLADIAPSLSNYRALGFSVIETADPGCVGLKAGASALILAALEFMAGDFEKSSVAPLEGRTIPYIWVKSVAAVKSLLPEQAIVVEQAVTRAGTLEALVKQGSQYSIFAEKCGATG